MFKTFSAEGATQFLGWITVLNRAFSAFPVRSRNSWGVAPG